jgi:protein involved in polysaccharide export with SLBB domain
MFQARVDRNGEIDAPIVGKLKVEGQELDDVEKTIHAAFVPAVYNEVSVHAALGDLDTTRVLVVGAVTAPGLISLRRNERTMLHAIVGAGGVSDVASGKATLRRVRRPGESTGIDVWDPYELQQSLALDPLENGDIIRVHAAPPNTIYVGGLVNRVGPQMYPAGSEVTILQALASAGGRRTELAPRDGTLIRRLSDGSDVHVRLNIPRLERGDDANVTLAMGDIVWIPETLGTKVRDFVNRNIFFRAGVSVTYNVTGVEYLNRASQQNGRGGGDQQGAFDPLGFLQRNTALQDLIARPAAAGP